MPLWFEGGGLLTGYRPCDFGQIRRKFTAAETAARLAYDRAGGHQDDPTGVSDEGDRPLHFRLFFEYFDFIRENPPASSQALARQQMNVRVNRSVIGQQPALSSQTDGRVELLSTVAPTGRDRGSGDIAGDVQIDLVNRSAVN